MPKETSENKETKEKLRSVVEHGEIDGHEFQCIANTFIHSFVSSHVWRRAHAKRQEEQTSRCCDLRRSMRTHELLLSRSGRRASDRSLE